MELTALDVTRATSLTYLYIKTNQLATLDLSNCTALTFVDCTENLLTSLNLPSTSTLTAVNCDNNLLTSLNVSGATGITELTCTNNKLTFATLPIKQPSWTTYTYSPQQNFDLPKQTYITNEEIDLSSQLTVGSNTTTYTWKTASGTTLVSGTDYNVTGGKFTFLKTYTESLYCEMTNATFPNLTLKTISISVLPTPSVIMTTTTAVGSSFSFGIGATTNNTPIQVDWGNGTLASYTVGTSQSSVSGTLAGNTIKIYGENISTLWFESLKITTLDVSKCLALSDLSCQYCIDLTNVELSNSITYLSLIANKLASIDVSKNSLLEYLTISQSPISSIDVSKNTKLKSLSINHTNISNVDLSNNLSLITFSCSYSKVNSLDLSKNILLRSLYCNMTNINALDVSNNLALTTLECKGNQLIVLDVSKNTALTNLNCASNKLSFATLPIKQETWTTYSYSPQAKVDLPQKQYSLTETVDLRSELTVNGNTTGYIWKTKEGTTLTAGTDYNTTNGVTTFLKVQTDSVYCEMTNAKFPDLTLTTSAIKVTEPIPSVIMTTTTTIGNAFSFDLNAVSNNTPIHVDWGNGSLVSYTINTSYSNVNGTLSGNTIKVYGEGITKLYLSSKNFTAIDVSGATQLTHLDCHSNQLTSLDVSKNTALVVLECYLNQLTNLDVSKNLALQELKCSINQLTSLDVTKNTSLKRLFCDSNQITTLDVSQNTALQDLYCDSNLLTSLDVTSNTLLQELLCFSNQLTSLDISKNIAIKELWCYSNKLNSLDVSKNNALEFLFCESNQLEYLDLSQNTALTEVRCHANNLTFSTLPIKETAWTTYIYSPQNVIKLSKKQYGLTETVDLSSELTVNSNNTNYTWKTKGGVTLTAGTDYNVNNGITTFLKVQTDSVYCEMTNATFPDLTLNTTNIKVSEYPLSVGDNEVAISVYPNPATDNFTIKMAEEILRVEVYTITGVKVFDNGLYNSTTVTVPLSSLPKGALLIKAYTRNGVYSGKVVKI